MTRGQLLALGLGRGAIDSRLRSGRLHVIHRGVYAVGHASLNQRGVWLAAVLAHGRAAALSHLSAAALWRLTKPGRGPVDVTSQRGRQGRRGIRLHRAVLRADERAWRHAIPVTSVARTLLDMAEAGPEERFRRAFEEADRLALLRCGDLDAVCRRGAGRRGRATLLRLMAEARSGITRSVLEDMFVSLCRERDLPAPVVNAPLLDFEVDALWPQQRLVVELDGFAFHGHRAAFERDRARDASLQAAGYRVVRLTYRRLEQEPDAVAAQLRGLLASSQVR